MPSLQETLQPYIGGQMRVMNLNQRYKFVGVVKSIEQVTGEGGRVIRIRVHFEWCAENEGFPRMVNNWKRSDRASFEVPVTVNLRELPGDRLSVDTGPYVGDDILLYLPGRWLINQPEE